MQSNSQAPQNEASGHFLPRSLEMAAFAELLPLRGVEASSNRIFNIWGEPKVGKSTFISEFRESELMLKTKVLWIQPTRDEMLDTIPEFIRACAKTLRYPAEPSKEEKIADQLESVQRGKVNPIISDDSILITRTSIANNKKPYVNQAAASSVGRTETAREDVEISVGLGESKANNQAEGFLDALPLQSLGTDLTIIYLERLSNLSVTIVDWLRDYVMPAATRGAYRRSVIFIIESLDPLKLAHPNETWGDWSNLTCDYRLYPLSEDDTYQLSLRSGLDEDSARYVCCKSLGYPLAAQKGIQEFRTGVFGGESNSSYVDFIEALEDEDLAKLAALSLPNRLYPDELDALFGPGEGKVALDWLRSIKGLSLQKTGDGVQLPDPLRKAAISAMTGNPAFKEYRSKWNPMGKLIANVPSRSNRSKLLLLSGLHWIDQAFCRQQFGEQAERVYSFLESNPLYFNRNKDRFRVTERFRPQLRAVAENMGHIGVNKVLDKARSLWEARKSEIEGRLAVLESELDRRQSESHSLMRKHSETLAQLRIQDRKSEEAPLASLVANAPSSGALVLLTTLLALALVASGSLSPYPYSIGLLTGGFVSLTLAIVYLPKWLSSRRLETSYTASGPSGAPLSLRKQNAELSHRIQEQETRIDDLRSEIAAAKNELQYAYVPD